MFLRFNVVEFLFSTIFKLKFTFKKKIMHLQRISNGKAREKPHLREGEAVESRVH